MNENSHNNNSNLNKYAYNQPWKDNENYFKKYSYYSDNNIENYTEQQLEVLNRAMDNIDYYMYISFYFCYDTSKEFDRTTHKLIECKGVEDKIDNYNIKFLFTSLYKLIPCILIQLVVNPINMYYAINDSDNLCRNQNSVLLKFVAIVISIFLTVSSFTAIKTESEKYGRSLFWFTAYFKGVRNFHNRGLMFTRMMFFFFFLNMYSSILTTVGTVFIIYNSEGVLEIVLNAMALKFIDEIDNISISKEEETEFTKLYENIKQDILMFQIDNQYKILIGDTTAIPDDVGDTSYGEILFVICAGFSTFITNIIICYSIVYLGICY